VKPLRLPVNSSHGQLVTKRQSTRHKQTNKQTTKPYCRTSVLIIITDIVLIRISHRSLRTQVKNTR